MSGGLPLVGHAMDFMRDPVALLERGHRECGGMFSLRLGPRRAVVLVGDEHHRFFFGETDKRLSIRTAYPFFIRMFDEAFYFFAERDEYHRQRALVAPRFQGRALDGYVADMEFETAALIDRLGDQGELDLIPTLGPLVMRIAARAFLGEDFANRMGGSFFTEFRRFSAGMDPVMPGWLPLPHLIRSRRAKARLHRLLGGLLAERRATPAEPPDFLQMLAAAHYPDGGPVPDVVLINLILLLSWAGHETTAGHISWALIDLLQHPDYLGRVMADEQLMDAALHESERLHPVAFILMRTALEDIEHDGRVIPKDSMILAAPSLAHRSDFDDPDAYRPERFLGQTGRDTGLIGFGGGLHRCLGEHFAYLEMRVILARLLSHYDLELVDRCPQPVRGAKTKWPESPCRVRYSVRHDDVSRGHRDDVTVAVGGGELDDDDALVRAPGVQFDDRPLAAE